MSKLNLMKLIVQSDANENISAQLREHFKVKVIKHLNTQYLLEFRTAAEAMRTFREETMMLHSKLLTFNFFYDLKECDDKSDVPVVVPGTVAVAKTGVKRAGADCENDTSMKKTKMDEGLGSIMEVEEDRPVV